MTSRARFFEPMLCRAVSECRMNNAPTVRTDSLLERRGFEPAVSSA